MIFNELDSNHDGFLDLQEVQRAFEVTFGRDSRELSQCQVIFNRLNLDGSAKMTYTEFCAAAMEEDLRMQEKVLWLAFQAFDVHARDTVSSEDLQQLLARADANESLSRSTLERAAHELLAA